MARVRAVNAGRRPITDEETPHLAALGARVRELRTAAGLTQSTAGTLAALTADHIGAIERGQRRTRATTLARIVAACGAEDPAATLAELVALNGKPIELWEGARMVSWCELIEGKIVMLRPDELRRA